MKEKEYTFFRLNQDSGIEDNEKVGKPFKIEENNLGTAKYVIFSDLHKGSGRKKSDAFLQNEYTYCYALNYYLEKDFKLILAGDIEEGWGFKLKNVVKRYKNTVFYCEKKFVEKGIQRGEGYYFRIIGNHDKGWGRKRRVRRLLIPALGNNEVKIYTSVFIGDRILILHGHQGDATSDKLKGIAKNVVRFVTQTIFSWFGRKKDRAATSAQIRKKRDKYLYEWAKDRKLLLIAGHTHRYIFKSSSNVNITKDDLDKFEQELKIEKEKDEKDSIKILRLEEYIKIVKEDISEVGDIPCYFNTGAGDYIDGITGIEIDNGEIKIIKWNSPRFNYKFTGILPDALPDPKRIEVFSESIDEILNQIPTI